MTVLYENELYEVRRDPDPQVEKAEPMNWLVVNKEHGTVESTVASLPNAIYLADQMSSMLKQLLSSEEQLELTLN